MQLKSEGLERVKCVLATVSEDKRENNHFFCLPRICSSNGCGLLGDKVLVTSGRLSMGFVCGAVGHGDAEERNSSVK